MEMPWNGDRSKRIMSIAGYQAPIAKDMENMEYMVRKLMK